MQNVEDVYALAPIQEGLLYHSLSDEGSGVFVDQISCVLEGDLDAALFKRAWEAVAARHPALRTCFLWDGLDQPLQVVRQQIDIPWVEEDWAHLSTDQQDAKLRTLQPEDRRHGFDLSEAPLIRMTLARLGPQAWRWVWTFHHLILDGWSKSTVMNEVFAAYRHERHGDKPDLAPPFRYRDYVAWHRQQDVEQAKQYWHRELDGFASPTRLYVTAPPTTTDASEYRQQQCPIPRDVTRKLSELAKRCRVSLNTVMQAGWSLLLSRYAHDDDVVFGVTTSGRPPELPGIENGVGLFINTLPMRPPIDPNARLVDWLPQLQKKQYEIRRWEFSPLAMVQRCSQVPAGQPLFESILVFENHPPTESHASAAGINIRDTQVMEHSNYPLAILVVPGEELELITVYDAGRFSDHAIAQMMSALTALLHSFVETPEKRLRRFSLASPVLQEALATPNDAPTDFPDDTCIHDLIAHTVNQHPDAPALAFEDQTLTYHQLNRQASRLASRLRAMGVGPEARVGLYIDRCPEMIVGILGILKAGGAYVPLDPQYPKTYTQLIMQDAGLSIVVTRQDLLESIPESDAQIVAADQPPPPTAPYLDDTPPSCHQSRSDGLAYVIYTSGSTGQPKGVMVTHRNLVHSTIARMDYYPTNVGRFLLLSSFAFDSSVAGIFWTLCTGGTLVLPPTRLEQDMPRLVSLIDQQRVTHLLCLPTLYQLILEHASPDHLASLRVAIVAGEACPVTVAQRHMMDLPETLLYNEYGPTEATVWSTVHRITADDQTGPIPIGKPIDRTQVSVLDQHQNPVPPGVCGEVYLSGMGLARGYLNREKATQRQFVHPPVDGPRNQRMYRTGDLACYREDGSLLYLGRCDAQVKIRGYRIELAGIQETLAQHPWIAEAAVTAHAHPVDPKRQQLVAYVVCREAEDPNVSDTPTNDTIRDDLRRRLPDHMVPEHIVTVDALPKLPNGKIDFKSLPDPKTANLHHDRPFVEPTTPTQRVLADIWSQLLGLDRVSIHDNFFDVGGDSILSIQLISRARQAGLPIEPKHIATHATIAQLAQVERIDDDPTQPSSWDSLVPLQAGGTKPPLFCVHAGGSHVLAYRHLAKRLGPDHPVYGLQPPGLDGVQQPLETIEDMAAHYVRELRSIQPQGPYHMIGYCVGASVCLELTRELERQGQQVAMLMVVDSGFWWGINPSTSAMGKIKIVSQKHGLRFLARLAMRKLSYRVTQRQPGESVDPVDPMDARLKRVDDACRRAFQAYRPKPCLAEVVLVRSQEFAQQSSRTDRHLQWQAYTPKLHVQVVPGGHDTLLQEPDVQHVAKAIQKHMNLAHRQPSPSQPVA